MTLLIARNAQKMSRGNSLCAAVLLGLIVAMPLPAPADAGEPTEQVRGAVDQVLTIVGSSQPASKGQIEARQARLAEVIYPRFDFTEMAKRSLGHHWSGRTPEQRMEFAKLFAALMARSFAANIESYTSQKILYTREIADQSYAEVDTKIIPENGSPVTVNYKLHSVGKVWKVYDLVIENVSVVNNYRSQFNRVITASSFEELLRVLKEKHSLLGIAVVDKS